MEFNEEDEDGDSVAPSTAQKRATQQPPSGRRRRNDALQDDLHGSGGFSGASSFRGGGGAASTPASGYPQMAHMSNGLDLSFGYTPMQFEKINLIGSELSEHAISSLVLSVPNITYLDLRGNKLDAAFGWKLVKAMKKKYLNLEFCNGVPLRALRTNSIDSLNLASFHSHHGMYGIEVVGAIFLAHFLRLNSSLTYLNFKRNDIEKDGAKALAQSLLGNPQCVLRTVNTMGEAKNKPGIDFSLFRTGQLTTVNLSKRLIDDDDFVFLEEWLRRYDCVTDLDISWNLLSKDGVRKLTRYVKESRTLVNLNCVGLPVNIEGSSLICRAVVENQTLRKVGLPLGPADDHPDRQQMLQQLGVGLANHPTLQSFASNRTPNLDYTLLAEVRENKVRVFPPERSSGWPKVQMQAYMWFLTAVKPDLDQLSFGGSGKPKVEYPKDAATSASKELWGPLLGIVHDVNRSLQHVSIAFPPGCTRGMEMMRVLTRCSQVRTLKLLAYASVPLKDSQLPTEWSSVGGAPRWLVEDRLKHRRTHWQALHGLLGALPQLEQFNDIVLGGMNMREQPELVCLLLMQCLEGVAVDLQEPPGGGAEAVLKSRLSAEADVDNFCDVLRLLSRTPLLIDLQFTDKRVQMVKAQQSRLAPALSGVGAGEGSPRFTHAVALRNNQVSETLLEALHCEAPLREFCYENIEGVLPALFAALCGKEKPLPIERIRVEPKWLQSRMSCKRFGDRQRRWLDGIQAALIRSDRFVELKSASAGTVSRSAIAAMSLQEFANVMTGISAEDMPEAERHPPQIPWRCFPSWRAFESPPDPHAMVPPLLVPLPMDEEVRAQLQLRKLSLCMCDMRPRLTRSARPDEWPEPSGPLWHGRRRFIRPGDWHEYEQVGEDGEDEDDGRHVRYHWQEHLRIGTQSACSMVSQVLDPNEPPFADSLLHEGLRSLLAEDSSLRWLDLRGNGLTREDANLVLSLVESHQSLESLNMIPVLESEAMACQSLEIDGTGMKKPEKKEADEDDPYGNDDEEDPPDEAYAREVFETEFVRMDEGDGYIFLQLVAPNFFPELKHVLLRKLEIPQDSTLAHITDALLNLQSVEQLRLSDLRLSSRGSSLLLQAVAELAPRLSSLNGLPLARLMQMRDSRDGGMLELPGNIEWNDFPLGAMARLNLWQVASFPPSQHGDAGELQLQGQSLTDVGLRGLCVMLRHFAGQDRIPMGPSLRGGAGTLNLTRIDLSGNPQITDATVADLCHTLQHPSMGGGLRHGLRELSVRSCMRLKTRSAYELLNFVQHVREATRESSANSLGNSLQLVNGVDLEALYTAGRATSGVNGARVSGPPMLLRCIVDLGDGGYSGRARSGLSLTSMSECDTHFLAGVLHQFPSIPYCHLHLVVPASLLAASTSPADKLDSFGRQQNLQGEGGTLMHRMEASNDSPFPQPVAGGRAEASLNAQLESARRFFEACPIAAQLRISMVPAVPGCEDLLLKGGQQILATSGGSSASSSAMDCFNHAKKRLQDKAAKKRKGAAPAAPVRPLYVNNINSQRLHCCFRTLYGKDDVEIAHDDVMPEGQRASSISLPSDVDVSQLFAVATSVDLQHLDLSPSHLTRLVNVMEMPVLTHVNLNHNHLGDVGIELLFRALVDAGSSVVHVSVASNNIGDEGAVIIATSLGSLPRLTSLELCDNFIQERGSIAIADAIGGVAPPEEEDGEEVIPVGPLKVLSIDLRGNRSRELGARRWAEVICNHPDLKFLCLAQNELGCLTKENFLDLVCAAVTSASLSVLDLQDNFPQTSGPGTITMGPPPADVIEELLAELPAGEFDPAEVRKAVFIRRHRGGGGGGGGSAEKKGRQPQQGTPSNGVTQRHPKDSPA